MTKLSGFDKLIDRLEKPLMDYAVSDGADTRLVLDALAILASAIIRCAEEDLDESPDENQRYLEQKVEALLRMRRAGVRQ